VKNRISSDFASDVSDGLCWASENVKIWGLRYTHFNCNCEKAVVGKRVVTNQRGIILVKLRGLIRLKY